MPQRKKLTYEEEQAQWFRRVILNSGRLERLWIETEVHLNLPTLTSEALRDSKLYNSLMSEPEFRLRDRVLADQMLRQIVLSTQAWKAKMSSRVEVPTDCTLIKEVGEFSLAGSYTGEPYKSITARYAGVNIVDSFPIANLIDTPERVHAFAKALVDAGITIKYSRFSDFGQDAVTSTVEYLNAFQSLSGTKFIINVKTDRVACITLNREYVKNKLNEEIDALVPTTPRGINILMPSHEEAFREGDLEYLRFKVGSWVWYKSDWEQERKWQQKEIARRQRGGKVKKTERNPIVMKFPDGSYVVDLPPSALMEETNRMGHCVGTNNYDKAVAAGEAKIFSLRDKWGDSVYTLEASIVDGMIAGFPQVKCHNNFVPLGTRGDGRNNAKLSEDTPQHLKNVIQFVLECGGLVSAENIQDTVPDLRQAYQLHPEWFPRQNPYDRRYRRQNPEPMYSFDEPWYPRE